MRASKSVVAGSMAAYDFMRRTLHEVAALAGLAKPVTTHLFRKSVGTHMARENPRLAREQLGITEKVFNRHYNQPTVEDRIQRRDLLMGGDGARPQAVEAHIGVLYLKMQRGVISQHEFERQVGRSLLPEAKPRLVPGDPAFM